MRWLKAIVVALALVVVAQVADARVPAFVRQTGLVCNQCHVAWTPVMDFTFTGMKFRMNGYRTPWVAEKIEAGDEGAVNGNRLLLTLGSALSWHLRGLFLGASTPTADPSAASPVQGAASTELIQTIGMHYCGPIGEHVGIFNEFYMYGGGLGPTAANGGTGGNRNGYIGLSHFDLAITTNSAGNIYGFTGTLVPSPGAHDFMQLNNDPTPTNMLRNPGIIGSGAPYVYWAFYGFVGDRFGLEMGVEPGEDNLDYRKFNYRIETGYFLANTDANFWRLSAEFKAGDDMIPGVSTLTASNDGVRTLVPADAVRGISGTRASGTPLSSLNMGDAWRWLFGIAGGFADKGPSSFDISVSQSIETETYTDASSAKMSATGGEAAYYYDRTWGLVLQYSRYDTWNFTDQNGVLHTIPSDPSWNITVVRRLAMNFCIYGAYGNSQTYALDQKWQDGKSWGIYLQYLW
jgi:hypothetical protein